MKTNELISKLQSSPESITFSDVMKTIESDYTYNPCRFFNGIGDDRFVNEAGSNEGSCKIFAFAKLNQLSTGETLQCFGDYYRIDVMQNPDGDDHANIRTFTHHGWDGIEFAGTALNLKTNVSH